jgi:hypothetical protein
VVCVVLPFLVPTIRGEFSSRSSPLKTLRKITLAKRTRRQPNLFPCTIAAARLDPPPRFPS